MTEWLFDGVLGLLVLGLAFGALHGRNLYASVLLFIAFGLALALIWARLGAADLALAEAAIGAGLTGVLLFTALSRQPGPADLPEATGMRLRLGAAAVVLPMLILLVQGLAPLSEVEPRLPALITRHLDETGVSHPVTAVLLNYRAWDTLLELAVLLLALLGARQLGPRPLDLAEPWPLLRAWARVLAPLLVLAAGYILWRGASAPGGAFQAGALLASGVVLLRLSGLLPRLRWSFMPLRLLVLGGLLVFVGVAVATAWLGEGWLAYPGGAAKPIILLIETVATLSIAASLSLLVVGEGEEVSS
ncbi:MAG TPA: sodium:proton antiporter [Pseudomonas sp.]|nr:sodium:proton antiporter [Pseudomonas sp.]|tara:strand:- start:28565 stop:29476 length:912 start_codon:yes stop_codon:yes gene_type:complete